MNRKTKTILTASALLATAGLLIAGPPKPLAGPVASSDKTLSEPEPRSAINATNTPGDANSLYQISPRASARGST